MPKRNWSESPFDSKAAFLRYHRKKAAKKNALRREINVQRKSELRTALKKAEVAITSGKAEEASSLYQRAAGLLDRAAQRGVIKKGKANRAKSRLASRINGLSA